MQPQFYAAATKRRTPAHLLYNHWLNTLETYFGPWVSGTDRSMNYGSERSYGISHAGVDSNGRPLIGFGPVWGTYNAGQRIILNADGEFQIRSLHGAFSRMLLARETFLDWSYQWSRYHWYYNLGGTGGRNYRDKTLADHHAQHHYLSEHLLVGQSLGSWRRDDVPWWRLAPTADDVNGWKIVFVRDNPGPNFQGTPTTVADVAKHEALRQKRYHRLEVAEKVEQGLIDPKTKRPFKTEDELANEQHSAAQILSGHFLTSTPAVTKPLKKFEEEGLWLPNGCP